MSNAHEEADRSAHLRRRAAEKLGIKRPLSNPRATQTEALAVLHQLASSPATASDAMALLHELQVHQVELDLQQEELHRSQAELETALRRQADLVERAPVGHVTVDARTVLIEVNMTGARLLGTTQDDLLGRPLADLLDASSVDALHALLGGAKDGAVPHTRELRLKATPDDGTKSAVLATASRDTVAKRFLLVLMAPAI